MRKSKYIRMLLIIVLINLTFSQSIYAGGFKEWLSNTFSASVTPGDEEAPLEPVEADTAQATDDAEAGPPWYSREIRLVKDNDKIFLDRVSKRGPFLNRLKWALKRNEYFEDFEDAFLLWLQVNTLFHQPEPETIPLEWDEATAALTLILNKLRSGNENG